MTRILSKSSRIVWMALDEALDALLVLRPEALVHDERADADAAALGEQLGQGDAQGEVDAEGLAAGEGLVGARHAARVGDLDVERLLRPTGLFVLQRLQRDARAAFGQPL